MAFKGMIISFKFNAGEKKQMSTKLQVYLKKKPDNVCRVIPFPGGQFTGVS